MGIRMQELLSLEYFKDFYVLAGSNGLDKEVQGVTIFEAPDAFRWTRGKELVFTSGYVLKHDPDCIYRAFEVGSTQRISGMMIKRDRYLDKIPEKMLQLFDQYNVPLISMPFSVPWMEVMNQINTAVMNRTIRRFRINTSSAMYQISNLSYKEQKIKRILQAVEAEMKFPVFLYDFAEEKSYYSSANFRRIADSYGLSDADFCEPSMPYTKHTLCDYLDMARYRLIEPVEEKNLSVEEYEEKPRVSWIRIPISMEGSVQAVFAVMESREFIDYYDEFALRIAFLTLQGIYEQIIAAQSVGDIGFENFVHFVLQSDGIDMASLMHRANVQGIVIPEKYVYVVFRQKNLSINAQAQRKIFIEIFRKCFVSPESRITFLTENEGVLFLDPNQRKSSKERKEILIKLQGLLQEKIPEVEMEFGVLGTPSPINDMKKSIEKCQKVLEMGKILYPKENIWTYEQLGPLTWLDIPEEELEDMLCTYKALLKDEKNIEILRTLKVYLESNMNFSVTAEKMYVHINTIRKRIDKVHELLNIDFTDYVGRLKVELLLQFMNLE